MKNFKWLFLSSFLFINFQLRADITMKNCEDSPKGTYTLTIQELVPIKCYSGTGTLRANVTVTSGTVTGIQYSWSGAGGGSTKDVIKRRGTYTVTVTTTNSGSNTATITFSAPNPIYSDLEAYHGCAGGNGEITFIKIKGGVPPFTAQLLDFQTKAIKYEASNIPSDGNITFSILPGNYAMIVLDNNGCSYDFNNINLKMVTTSKKLEDGGFTIIPAKCFTSRDGFIECKPEKIHPDLISRYKVELKLNGKYFNYNETYLPESTILWNLLPGTYDLKINFVDVLLCGLEQSITIPSPDKIENTEFTANDIICFGQRNGEIIQAIEGGITPYTYLWDDGETTANRDRLFKGNYSCKVKDKNNCTANFTYTINEPAELLQIAKRIVPEKWNAKGSIDLDIQGGIPPYNFDWSGPFNFKSGFEDISGLLSGKYSLVLEDQNGCINEKLYTVDFNTATHSVHSKPLQFIQYQDELILNGLDHSSEYVFKMFDMKGTLVKHQKIHPTLNEISIPIGNEVPGMYGLQLMSGMDIYTAKWLKL